MCPQARRLTINAEVMVQVTDPEALKAEALRRVSAAEFMADAGQSVDEIRAAESHDVRGDVARALSWLTSSSMLYGATGVAPIRAAPVVDPRVRSSVSM